MSGWLIFVNMGDLGLVVCLISAPGICGINAAFFVRFKHPESVKLKLGYYCALSSQCNNTCNSAFLVVTEPSFHGFPVLKPDKVRGSG